MTEIKIPWNKISLAEFISLADTFRGEYEDIYVDGDEKAVVVTNPSDKMRKALVRVL